MDPYDELYYPATWFGRIPSQTQPEPLPLCDQEIPAEGVE